MRDYLTQRVDQIDPYVWPFLRDNLAVCHCLFSRNAVSITPIFPPVYMATTIADDSEIVHTFGASLEAVAKPITSTSLAGVGERMVLVAELMKLSGIAIMPMVTNIAIKLAARRKGVAILTPSNAAAKT